MAATTPQNNNTSIQVENTADFVGPPAPDMQQAAAPAPGELQPNFLEILINAIMKAFETMGMTQPDEKDVEKKVDQLSPMEKDNINAVGENIQEQKALEGKEESKESDGKEAAKIDKTEEGKEEGKAEGEARADDMRSSLGKIFSGLGGEAGLIMGLVAIAMTVFQKDVAEADAKEAGKEGPQQAAEMGPPAPEKTTEEVSATVSVTEPVYEAPKMGGKVDVEVKGTQEVEESYDPEQSMSSRSEGQDQGFSMPAFAADAVGIAMLTEIISNLGSVVEDTGMPIGIQDMGDSMAAYSVADGASISVPAETPVVPGYDQGAGIAIA